MKRTILITFLALAGSIAMMAQPGMGGMRMGGGMPGFGMAANTMTQPSPETIKAKTDSMIVEYGLSDEQAEMLLGVNTAYFGKITFPIVRDPLPELADAGEAQQQRFDPRNMSQEDMEKAMQQMQDMQDQAAKMEQNQTAYENALGAFLDKKQMKSFKKHKSQYNNLMRNRMEAEFRSQMGGFGGGGFGGGGMGRF